MLMTYLLSSAVSRFDRRQLTATESLARFVIGLAMIVPDPVVHFGALALGGAVVAFHTLTDRNPFSAFSRQIGAILLILDR